MPHKVPQCIPMCYYAAADNKCGSIPSATPSTPAMLPLSLFCTRTGDLLGSWQTVWPSKRLTHFFLKLIVLISSHVGKVSDKLCHGPHKAPKSVPGACLQAITQFIYYRFIYWLLRNSLKGGRLPSTTPFNSCYINHIYTSWVWTSSCFNKEKVPFLKWYC